MNAATATAPSPAITREMLEDRYEGAINTIHNQGYSDLGLKLAVLVDELVCEVARRDDDHALSGTGGLEEPVMAAIRETVIGEIDERGLAR